MHSLTKTIYSFLGILICSSALAQKPTVEEMKFLNIKVVNALAVDRENAKWIGTETGLFSFRNDSLKAFNPGEITPVSALYIDRDNNKWIGTYNSIVYRMTPQGRLDRFDFSAFGSYIVTAIDMDANNKLWISTYGKGIFTLDSWGTKNIYVEENSDLPYDQVFDVFVDSRDTRWFATERGLCSLEGSKKWKVYEEITSQVNAIAEHQGSLWVAAYGLDGAELWQYKNFKKWERVSLPGELQYSRIKGITFDAKHRCWLAADKVVYLENNRWNVYSQNEGFTSTSALAIAADQKDAIWVGTEGKGLFNIAVRPNAPAPAAAQGISGITQVKDEMLDKPIKLNIMFEQSKAELTAESRPELDRLGLLLQQNPDLLMEISGHTDNVGNPRLNLKLSEERALAVKNYLVNNARIDTRRISTIGYGDTRPIGDNREEANRILNRRVEIRMFRKNNE